MLLILGLHKLDAQLDIHLLVGQAGEFLLKGLKIRLLQLLPAL